VKRKFLLALTVVMTISLLLLQVSPALAGDGNNGNGNGSGQGQTGRVTPADRAKAALAAKIARGGTPIVPNATLDPLATPDYFGTIPNYANSPLPVTAADGTVVTGSGIRKFVDTLPGLGSANINDLLQYLPIAVADKSTYPGTDYYEIGLVQYTQKMHKDLPATTLRGYVQISTAVVPGKHIALGVNDANGNPVYAVDNPQYLGPIIVATENVPVRVKFTNFLSSVSGGNLFLPVDETLMGAGLGPNNQVTALTITNGGTGYTSTPIIAITGGGGVGATAVATVLNGKVNTIQMTNPGSGYTSKPTVTFTGGGGTGATANASFSPAQLLYSENRATLHLHGGVTPWISDGTPHQWTTPVGSSTETYPKGVSVVNVPDMPDPGPGSLTFFYTNQQSARLMFYHDHAYGITRLNVYAGEAAGYVLQDPVEQTLVTGGTVGGTVIAAGTIPANQIPLIIQDKSFVPQTAQLAAEDPTWDTVKYGGYGNLWFPHVYMPNQNPYNTSVTGGANAMGRWDYGPWFWPPFTGLTNGPVANPLSGTTPFEGPVNPGIPNPSSVPEAFMDTPLVNGTAYPALNLLPQAYRFRILSAGNDRSLNLSLFVADPLAIGLTNQGSGYTSVPTVGLTGGSVSGAIATAILGLVSITGGTGGSGYTVAPAVNITPAVGDTTGAGASAVAILSTTTPGSIDSIMVTSSGSNYTLPPVVTIAAPPAGGTAPSAATALLGVVSIKVGGAPIVGLAAATPPYWTAPTVTISGGGGTGATAIASVNSEVKMVPAAAGTAGTAGYTYPDQLDGRLGGVPDSTSAGPAWYVIGNEGGLMPQIGVIQPGPVGYEYNRRSITVLNVSNKALFLGPAERADVVVDFSAFAGKTIILYNDSPAPVPAFDPRYDYYTGDPDQRDTGGAPTTLPGYGPNTRTIMQINIAASPTATWPGLPALQTAITKAYAATQPAPVVPESAYNAAFGTTSTDTYVSIQDTSITFLPTGAKPVSSVTVTNGGSGYTSVPNVSFNPVGATAIASLAAFGSVKLANVTNGGRNYTSAPTVTFSAPTSGVTATGTASIANGAVIAVTVTNPGSGYTTAPTITFSGGGGRQASATAVLGFAVAGVTVTNGGSYTIAPAVTIDPPSAGGNFNVQATAIANLTVTIGLYPKAIIEDFTKDYGRMNALLGVELPNTNINNQTSIPYGYLDPPTEIIQGSYAGSLLGVLADGTQIWKITHNGVDTHAIHTHLFDMQVINRIGWDGAVKPPSAYELGWKDTVLMNPLEDIVIAFRPIVPTLPAGMQIPNSYRAMDVTMPLGSTGQFQGIEPGTNNPITVTNEVINYGWEYVYHCHLLGHEENDMMHAMAVAVPPVAPTNLASPGASTLSWMDNSRNETQWVVQQLVAGTWTSIISIPSTTGSGTGSTVTYKNSAIKKGSTYRVLAGNAVGSQLVGEFNLTVYSLPSNQFTP